MSRLTVACVTAWPRRVQPVDELPLAADRLALDELEDQPLAVALRAGGERLGAGPFVDGRVAGAVDGGGATSAGVPALHVRRLRPPDRAAVIRVPNVGSLERAVERAIGGRSRR